MADWIFLVILVVAILVGIFLGAWFVKLSNKSKDKKLIRNLEEVLEGTRKNEIEIEGKKYNVNRFRLQDDEGKEIVIDLKGGEEIEDGKEEIEKGKEGNNLEGLPPINRKDSRSIGKEKRNIRRRFRRFG